MDHLHAQLDDKTLLAFSSRPDEGLTTLVQAFGGSLIWSATIGDALAALTGHVIHGAILDGEAGAETLFDIAEALEARQIPFVFAIHVTPAGPSPNFRGYTFPLDGEELRAIIDHLFGVPVVH